MIEPPPIVAAESVDLRRVHAIGGFALDSQIIDLHMGAGTAFPVRVRRVGLIGVRRILTVKSDARPMQDGVPGAGSTNRDLIQDDVPGDQVAAYGNV